MKVKQITATYLSGSKSFPKIIFMVQINSRRRSLSITKTVHLQNKHYCSSFSKLLVNLVLIFLTEAKVL